jgi:hypothetical protein
MDRNSGQDLPGEEIHAGCENVVRVAKSLLKVRGRHCRKKRGSGSPRQDRIGQERKKERKKGLIFVSKGFYKFQGQKVVGLKMG